MTHGISLWSLVRLVKFLNLKNNNAHLRVWCLPNSGKYFDSDDGWSIAGGTINIESNLLKTAVHGKKT